MILSLLILATPHALATPADGQDREERPKGRAKIGSCRTKVESLSSWLEVYGSEMDRQPWFPAISEGLELVPINRPPSEVQSAMVIALSADRTTLGGDPTPVDAAGLTSWLRTALAADKRIAAITKRSPVDLSVEIAIDRRVQWTRVVETFEAIVNAGASSATLLFRSSKLRTVPVPGPSSIDARLQKIRVAEDPIKRAGMLSDVVKELTSRCPSLRGPLAAAARKSGLMSDDIAKSVLACKCAVDIPAFMTLLWANRPPDPGTSASLVLPKPGMPDSAVTTITVDGNTPWSTAHEKVVAAISANPGKPVRLRK